MKLGPSTFNFVSYKFFAKEFRVWADGSQLTKLKFGELTINEIES